MKQLDGTMRSYVVLTFLYLALTISISANQAIILHFYLTTAGPRSLQVILEAILSTAYGICLVVGIRYLINIILNTDHLRKPEEV